MWMRALPLLLGCLGLLATVRVPPVVAGPSSEALRIARESQPRWTIGAVRLRDAHGRVRARADLVADGVVIARLRLDPKTGAPVADTRDAEGVTAGDVARLATEAARALSRVEIGGWAWPAEHGRAWRVPLRYDGRVIGTVTVDVRRGRLVGKDERDHDHGEGDDS